VVEGHDTLAGFNPDGTMHKIIKPEGVASLETVAVADTGDLYAADYGGQVLQLSPDGKLLDKWSVQLPQGLDVTDGSKIAVSSNAGVAVFTPEGEILAKWGTRGSGEDQFDLPHAVLMGQDGTLFVADTQNRRVRAFSPEGRLNWSTGITPDRSKEGSADFRNPENNKGPFAIPSGLAFNGKGQLVVVDPFKFTITVLDSTTGEIVKLPGEDGKPGRQAVFGDFGQADGLFAYPTGIAYDNSRDWFAVADTANNRVQILRLPESGGSPAAELVGAFRLPMLVFFFPLILLLLAIVLQLMRRRKKRQLSSEIGGMRPSPEAS
jgi:DNA-binding beta-propeller fold protein YncE